MENSRRSFFMLPCVRASALCSTGKHTCCNWLARKKWRSPLGLYPEDEFLRINLSLRFFLPDLREDLASISFISKVIFASLLRSLHKSLSYLAFSLSEVYIRCQFLLYSQITLFRTSSAQLLCRARRGNIYILVAHARLDELNDIQAFLFY